MTVLCAWRRRGLHWWWVGSGRWAWLEFSPRFPEAVVAMTSRGHGSVSCLGNGRVQSGRDALLGFEPVQVPSTAANWNGVHAKGRRLCGAPQPYTPRLICQPGGAPRLIDDRAVTNQCGLGLLGAETLADVLIAVEWAPAVWRCRATESAAAGTSRSHKTNLVGGQSVGGGHAARAPRVLHSSPIGLISRRTPPMLGCTTTWRQGTMYMAARTGANETTLGARGHVPRTKPRERASYLRAAMARLTLGPPAPWGLCTVMLRDAAL